MIIQKSRTGDLAINWISYTAPLERAEYTASTCFSPVLLLFADPVYRPLYPWPILSISRKSTGIFSVLIYPRVVFQTSSDRLFRSLPSLVLQNSRLMSSKTMENGAYLKLLGRHPKSWCLCGFLYSVTRLVRSRTDAICTAIVARSIEMGSGNEGAERSPWGNGAKCMCGTVPMHALHQVPRSLVVLFRTII